MRTILALTLALWALPLDAPAHAGPPGGECAARSGGISFACLGRHARRYQAAPLRVNTLHGQWEMRIFSEIPPALRPSDASRIYRDTR